MGSVGNGNQSNQSTIYVANNYYESPNDSNSEVNQRMSDVFTKQTGISIDKNTINNCNPDLLAATFNAITNRGYDYNNMGLSSIVTRVNSNSSAMASTNGSTLYLNSKYYGSNVTATAAAYQTDEASGWHPKGTTYKNIVDHEMGHVATKNILSKNLGMFDAHNQWANDKFNGSSWVTTNILKPAFQKAFPSERATYKNIKEFTAANISRYGATKCHETTAEAWADVIANGDKANIYSKEIVKIMKTYM